MDAVAAASPISAAGGVASSRQDQTPITDADQLRLVDMAGNPLPPEKNRRPRPQSVGAGHGGQSRLSEQSGSLSRPRRRDSRRERRALEGRATRRLEQLVPHGGDRPADGLRAGRGEDGAGERPHRTLAPDLTSVRTRNGRRPQGVTPLGAAARSVFATARVVAGSSHPCRVGVILPRYPPPTGYVRGLLRVFSSIDPFVRAS